MADKSNIEWTEATWNPIVGCSIVSPGCTNCYAMKMAARIEAMGKVPHYAGLTKPSRGGAVWTGKIAVAPEHILLQPLRWTRPRQIFVNSMSDLFHEDVPDEVIDQVFAVMALAPQHTFQVLTKRPARMREYVSSLVNARALAPIVAELVRSNVLGPRTMTLARVLPNVWLGTSVEDQKRADERIPELLATPAAVRWISAEPLLGPVVLWHDEIAHRAESLLNATIPGLDWVVVGGESGPGSRPMHPDWARSLRYQCAKIGVPFFFKQWGEFVPQYSTDINPNYWSAQPGDFADHPVHGGWCFGRNASQRPWMMFRRGKKDAGRLLDGVEHNEYPRRAA